MAHEHRFSLDRQLDHAGSAHLYRFFAWCECGLELSDKEIVVILDKDGAQKARIKELERIRSVLERADKNMGPQTWRKWWKDRQEALDAVARPKEGDGH